MSQPNLTQKDFLKVAGSLLMNQQFIIVDGGGRNKTWELPGLAPLCNVLSFEPNPHEYAKLLFNTTDVEKLLGWKEPPYHSIKYLDKALSNKINVEMLRITEGPGACSLLEPNLEIISLLEYYSPHNKLFAPQFRVVREEEIETTTLDHVMSEERIDRIDYLKLDTQGNELDCLHGATTLFREKKIGIIKTEVEFFELYQNQKLFADVDAFLRSQGFILLDLVFGEEHKVILKNKSFKSLKGNRGILLFADAYYALSLDGHKDSIDADLLRHGLILGELGFLDFAYKLLEKLITGLPDGTLSSLMAYWQRDTRNWKRKIKDHCRSFFRIFERLLGE